MNQPDIGRSIAAQGCSVQRGFTLIELLVVMAVLAVVAALFFPTLSNTRSVSEEVRCLNNLRQLATGAFGYAADNNGLLPDRTLWPTATSTPRSLVPYVGLAFREATAAPSAKQSVFTCPAIYQSPYRPGDNQDWARTYSINQYSTGSDGGGAAVRTDWESHVRDYEAPLRVLNVKNAAEQAFFIDGTVLREAAGNRYSVHTSPSRLEPADENNAAAWVTPMIHNKKVNVVYLDGHASSITQIHAERELISVTNAAGSKRKIPFWGSGK
jgi:prepilin-type N-terminal cleavage/methylation domain-containing protein/prepilin-type processing-associated H-X9-DG protein